MYSKAGSLSITHAVRPALTNSKSLNFARIAAYHHQCVHQLRIAVLLIRLGPRLLAIAPRPDLRLVATAPHLDPRLVATTLLHADLQQLEAAALDQDLTERATVKEVMMVALVVPENAAASLMIAGATAVTRSVDT
jgi:hypothetical protein